MAEEKTGENKGLNRRDFLKGIGAGAIGGGLIVISVPVFSKSYRQDYQSHVKY